MNYKAEYKPSELLCPVTSKWVDFETAKKVLEERSPDRHCCALFDVTHSAEDEASITAMKQSAVDKMALDIGTSPEESQVVRVNMLNGQGRELVDPVVKEFVNEVGVDMCSRFVIKLS
jgi:arginine-tRNA-protein transferase